jgi:hypothetical protein
MSKTTIKVLEIDTNPAKTSIKDLRKELKGFKDEMANLEEGSDEFLEVARKAGEVKHQLDEINESIKGASADFGDMIGNITNVAAGLTGAFQAVAGGLQAIGVESEAIDETIKRMQGLMAVTQGLSAIDDGIKSFKKLKTSIEGSTAAMKIFKAVSKPAVLAGIAAVVIAIGAAWNKWGDSIRKNMPWLDKWIKKVDGTTEKELERLREREEAFNEYYDKITEAADDIKEKRALDVLTQDARDKIAEYKDDIILLEAEVAKFQKLANENQDNRTIWEGYIQEGVRLQNQIRDIKNAINDLYTNPQYRLENQTNEVEVGDNTEGGEDNTTREKGLKLKTKKIAISTKQLVVEAEDMSLDRVLKPQEDKRLKDLLNDRKAGNAYFDRMSEVMGVFGESSLGLSSGWVSAMEDFQSVFNQTMDIVQARGEKTWHAYANVAGTALGGIGTMLNALSQEQDLSTEHGFEQQKKLQIAATIMNMLSGAMAAWHSSMALPAPASFITGAVQVASTLALGAAQVAKIKSTTMDSAMASGAINPSLGAIKNMIVPPVQQSAAVQGANIEGAIKSQKVIVVESDIADTITRVNVAEDENTY